jgi:hypothetical protein
MHHLHGFQTRNIPKQRIGYKPDFMGAQIGCMLVSHALVWRVEVQEGGWHGLARHLLR